METAFKPSTTEQSHIIPERESLPADPNVRVTPDQLLSIFGGTDRLNAERDLLRRLREESDHNVA